MTYNELKSAVEILGLNETATLDEIKKRHRDLAKRYHPDNHQSLDEDEVKIREINQAYKIISEYISSYQFSFEEEQFYKQNSEEFIRMQFMNDPVWGKGI